MTLFVVSSICFSCTEKIYYISIETQKPATYMLPDSVSHFVVVNNAINQPADFANEVMIYGKNKERASINADSLTFYLGLGLYDILDRNEFVPKVTYYSFDTKKGKNPKKLQSARAKPKLDNGTMHKNRGQQLCKVRTKKTRDEPLTTLLWPTKCKAI